MNKNRTKGIKLFFIGFGIFLIGIISFYFTSKLPGAIPLSDYKMWLLLFLAAVAIFIAAKPLIDKIIDRYYKK